MVVVAEEAVGDAAEDTPVSIRSNADSVEATKVHCHNPINQKTTDSQAKYELFMGSSRYATPDQLTLVTGPSVDLHAPLYDGNVPLDKVLVFSSTTATTRDIIHAVASSCSYLPVGSFAVTLVFGSSVPPIKLDDDEKTIRDYDINPSTTQIVKIVIEREDPSHWQSSEHVSSDVWLELRLVYARDPDEKVKLYWSLLVQKTTTASDVWQIITTSPRLPDIKGDAQMMLVVQDLKISSDYTAQTLEELGLDFSVPDLLILELTDADNPEIDQKCRDSQRPKRGVKSSKPMDKTQQPVKSGIKNCKRYVRSAKPMDKTQPGESLMWNFQSMVNSESDVQQNDTFEPSEFSPQSPETETHSEEVYVGLVNQAMTCYLNSLLQALYMTPEFRNALYNWVYAEASEKDEASSMPYQLQKLFLNLQTSTKNAVETTALTKSFGWDSTEAWQQHDIQELCRVMFDALEQKFKNTEQADLINQLYEGKMIDYVKCLECSTEKSREDTFLDIPLPVRPFGSTVAYNSVEEALQAFVQPETLDGVNQYFCETCNKKCDAHKGLKFTKFPYLLTLHLKRFDFDYSTYHRIKLNDKVTFPDTLHLNSFIAGSNSSDSPPEDEHEDSATATEEIPVDEECPSTSSGQQQCERNRKNQDCKGPYQYELFSIMIHSGNASGGHYYAYIKDFRTNEWLCFNDQNVSSITRDDIQKTYGGGPSRAYYSGAYSSSTNAYMLMYRQIDPTRNVLPMKVEEFPKHIQDLLIKIKEQEEEKRNNMRSRSMTKITMYIYHPKEKILTTTKMLIQYDTTLTKMLERAYRNFSLEGVVDFDQCRLVQYRPAYDAIEFSYDGMENQLIDTIVQHKYYVQSHISLNHMLLEIRDKDAKFLTYPVCNIITLIYVMDATTRRMIVAPFMVRALKTTTLGDFVSMVTQMLPSNLQRCAAKLFLWTLVTDRKMLESNDTQLEGMLPYNCGKGLLAVKPDVSGTIVCEQLYGTHCGNAELMEKVDKIVMLHLPLPDTRKETLEKMNITPWECRAREVTTNGPTKTLNGDVAAKFNKGDPGDVLLARIPTDETKSTAVEGEEWQEQSNSEDSSLSDSDRTLVGDASEDDEFGLTDTETELHKVGANRRDAEEEDWFFIVGERIKTPVDRFKLYVDKHISTDALKKHIEPLIKVAANDFDIHRQSFNSEEMRLFSSSSTPMFDDGDTITVKLRRSLRDNEFKVFLYNFLLAKNFSAPKYMCSWVICEDSTVGQVKKEIAAEFDIKSIRLRKKNNKSPGKVLLDHQKIKDLDLRTTTEIIIQELPVKEDPVTDLNQIVVIAWKYQCSADISSQKYEEIVLNNSSLVELRDKLVELSGVAAENLTFFVDTWPMTSNRSNKKDSPVGEWRTFADCESETVTLDDSSIVFYKEITEDPKDENSHSPLPTEIHFYRKFDDPPPRREVCWNLRRRELGLKIHLDDE